MNSREREMNLRIGGFWNFGFGFCSFFICFCGGLVLWKKGIERGRWIWRRGVLDGRKNDDGKRFFGCDTVLRLLLLSMR